MALREQKLEAIRMRKNGASYSQIKERLQVSKSTLSLWLRDMPLSERRLRELRDFNATRIERYRETRRKTREMRWARVYEQAKGGIGKLDKRDIFIAGLFLYWGEGGKTKWCTTSLSNTDPAMIRFFIHWLQALGAHKERMRVHLHLYADMNSKQERRYWSKELNLPLTAFRKSYIKTTNRKDITYSQKFTHGTCNLIYENRDVSEYVSQSLQYLRSAFAGEEGV